MMTDNMWAGQEPENKKYSANGYSMDLPAEVRTQLAAYKANEDDYGARNSLFQALYQKDSGLASSMAGNDNLRGYNGMYNALKQAYGITDAEKANEVNNMMNNKSNGQSGNQAAVQVNSAAPTDMPGANTDSALGLLHKK